MFNKKRMNLNSNLLINIKQSLSDANEHNYSSTDYYKFHIPMQTLG